MISAYNRRMHVVSRTSMRSFFRPLLFSCLLVATTTASAQTSPRPTPSAGRAEADRAVSLVESGHCTEALPLLRKSIRQTTDHDLKKRLGLDGLRCAMTRNVPYDSLEFLAVLIREFPRDPGGLYPATPAFSDLSLHASPDLSRAAPLSYQ